MDEIINPYIAGAPVTEQRMFFGREDVFRWIETSLTGQYADHILVLHGQRRVGKTSVLKQLGNYLPKKYIPVFFDLQGRTHTTLDRFLWWLAREIVRVLKQERGIEVSIPDKEEFTSDPEYLENKFLAGLRPTLGENSLLLTFDEFDNLEESEVKDELARPLIDHLRRMMGEANLNFIFSIGSSGRKLENMQASYTEFFKTALYKKISFLSRDQTVHLITKPVEGVLEYERAAVEMIFETTFGHPYFTQLMCHELFARCQSTEQRRVTKNDVAAILGDVVERGTVNLKFVWDEASDIEKWSLTALAHMEGKSDNRAIGEYLRKNRVRFSETDLTSGLLHLHEKDVLTTENHFVIGLLRLWLQKNRPIEQAREELTEVNPIANRYIEIGLEFKDSHQYEKAIESFQEALAIAKDNVQAQVNIALVLMDQKAYEKAVVEFEKALVMDDEDVSARAGLCEAHLALGDSALARGRTKDAVTSYGRVLGINAEHTEARQRMAEISRERAEKALTGGRDEEALSAFGEALKFTPEDENLARRFEEAKKERQEKVLSALLARAEKELTAKNWNAAIGILQDGLQLSKDDEQFKKKITTAREKQRTAQLEAILARASQAEQAGKWGTAITVLEESLTIEKDQPQVRERIEHARAKLREVQLRDLRERARGFARSERWDEALAAWDEFLKQEPSDEAAQRERREIEKSRTLALTYAEAQRALAKKNYDKAIPLFKSIVMEDADYKDATRRMAEAVELRRTSKKWWQSKWMWGGAAAGLILVAGWFAFRPGSSLMSALLAPANPSMETSAASTAPATLAAATAAPTATAMFTQVPLAWKRVNSGQFLSRDSITAIVIDPNDPGVMYIGTNNAGIYKSIDGGVSWQPIHNGLGRAAIYTLIMDPSNAQVLYAGTLLGGVYKTTDGGLTWNEMNNGITRRHEWVAILAMDQQDAEHLYFTDAAGLFETRNGGFSWQNISGSCPENLVGLVVDPTDGNTLYGAEFGSGGCKGGIYKSTDGGYHWKTTGLISTEQEWLQWGALWIEPTAGKTIYTMMGGQLWVSFDSGETWEESGQYCHALVFSAQDPSTVYCGRDDSIQKTTDGGRQWENIVINTSGRAIHLAVAPNNESILFWGELGLYVSMDGGKTSQQYGSGLGGNKLELKSPPSNTSVLYAQAFDGSISISMDNARNWSNMDSISNGKSMYFDKEGKTIYLLYESGEDAIGISEDNGDTWTKVAFPPSYPKPNSIAAHPILNRLYALYSRNTPPYIFYSDDGGETWLAAKSMQDIHDPRLFFDQDNGEVVYVVGDREISRSEDGGMTWKSCAGPPSEIFWVSSLDARAVINRRDSDHLLVATRGEGVVISDDGCQSWQASNDGLGSLFVNTLASDPNNPDTFYAATDGGAYVSFDGGETWGEINDGLLGATVVYSIVVDKDSNVYAATPYGIFVLEGNQ